MYSTVSLKRLESTTKNHSIESYKDYPIYILDESDAKRLHTPLGLVVNNIRNNMSGSEAEKAFGEYSMNIEHEGENGTVYRLTTNGHCKIIDVYTQNENVQVYGYAIMDGNPLSDCKIYGSGPYLIYVPKTEDPLYIKYRSSFDTMYGKAYDEGVFTPSVNTSSSNIEPIKNLGLNWFIQNGSEYYILKKTFGNDPVSIVESAESDTYFITKTVSCEIVSGDEKGVVDFLNTNWSIQSPYSTADILPDNTEFYVEYFNGKIEYGVKSSNIAMKDNLITFMQYAVFEN